MFFTLNNIKHKLSFQRIIGLLTGAIRLALPYNQQKNGNVYIVVLFRKQNLS